MKIVFSANTAWYLFNFRRGTIIRYIELGHDVHVIAPNDKYSKKLKELGVKCHHLYLQSNGMNPFLDFITLLNLTYIYLFIKPDVVYNFTPKINIYSAFVLFVFPSTKIVNNIAGLGTAFITNGFKKKILHWLYKLSQRRADVIFFQNEDDMSYFIEYNLVLGHKAKRILGSGVNLELFSPSRMCRDTVVKFILVARLIEQKGVSLYAKAAEIIRYKNPDAQFYLLGPILKNNPNAISQDDVTQWETDGHIIYLGQSDNVADILTDFDCVVLPSYYREGVPKSLLEAAASGKIIITTNNVGCKDTVIDGISGFLCESKSLNELIFAINKVLNLSVDDFISMKHAARLLALEKFDENIIINEYLNTIK